MVQAAWMLAIQGTDSYERLFGLDPQLLQDALFTSIAIFVLFFALSYLLFNPVRDILKKRQEKIRTDLDTAQGNRKEAERLKILSEEKLQHVDQEAEERLRDARKRAKKAEEDLISQAKEEAERIRKRAGMEIELEKKRAMDDLRKEMIVIAAEMAQKVVSANMTETLQDTLVKETLEEMGEDTWRS